MLFKYYRFSIYTVDLPHPHSSCQHRNIQKRYTLFDDCPTNIASTVKIYD